MKRREFLKGATLTSLGLSFGIEEIILPAQGTQTTPEEKPAGPPVNCAVIGLGYQGREILQSLAKIGAKSAPVVALCDINTNPQYLKRATSIAPKAEVTADYRKVLAQPDVQAIFIATPTHRHKEIALAALQAGKHVYCEAPLANTVEDAAAIAKAALADSKRIFQAGLQNRSNKMHRHILNFMRSGVLGRTKAAGRAQYHKRGTWRRGGSGGSEKEINWRLYKETSPGLMGEVGIHQIDVAGWFLRAQPISVTGFGSLLEFSKDGMEIPDTIQCVFEFPRNFRFLYDATIVSSFDGSYELFMGSDLAVLIRDQRGWMFKEADSPLLGWEVYARKDTLSVGDYATGTGIALVADATKLMAQGKEPGKVGADVSKTALYQAIDAFLQSVRTGEKPNAGPLEGYQATLVALKANEAILTGSKITFEKDWFTLS